LAAQYGGRANVAGLRTQDLSALFSVKHIGAQPLRNACEILTRARAKGKELADLCAVVAARPPTPVVLLVELWRDVKLLGHIGNRGRRNVMKRGRKATFKRKGFEHDGEA
jgi:hypothetical protein